MLDKLWQWLRFGGRTDPITTIQMPDAKTVIDDRHRIVLIYNEDAGLPDAAYDDLIAHFERRGYCLYISTAPQQTLIPLTAIPKANGAS